MSPKGDRSPLAAPIVIARAQAGDRAAVDAVLGALQGPLFRHIATIVGDAEDARDVLQDVLWIIARKLPSLRETTLLRAWAYRIATRAAIRHSTAARRWRDMIRNPESIDNALSTAQPDSLDEDGLVDIVALRETLSPASEAVIRMHYDDGLTFIEIGEALEIPVGTVKSRVAYGLAAMRKRHALLGRIGADARTPAV